ncbi:class I SAM-dependent methyltransferase [Saccharothrix obliqua]|uniref:class I SAM-dependent methyltransferase n=1 Tax=Saccharothrix obliqua TaxID=2861747 RepID=UPI0027E37668|nr:class I SAM-dependent methyltransferase [Saccharothrix obliqua]
MEHSKSVLITRDLSADRLVRVARSGTAVLWRGDYRTAVRLLAAVKRRLTPRTAVSFEDHRRAVARRAHVLAHLLVELSPDGLALPHAPDVVAAWRQAHGPLDGLVRTPLTGLLGVLGAFRWRAEGVWVPALDARVHPHYGVFAPTRQEYLDLVARAPWPAPATAFDVGTGTGVLAALLARRGARHVVATDVSARAVACAVDNVTRLGLAGVVRVRHADLFPPGRADLVVCNPPWLPGVPSSDLDAAVYDPGSAVLRGFAAGLARRLNPGGEGWLVLSDLAERLGLRAPGEVPALFAAAGLAVLDRLDVRPRHRTARRGDPFAAQRAAEVTSLWRLGVSGPRRAPGSTR